MNNTISPPFGEKDLLSSSSFVVYCNKHGQEITKRELQQWEQEGLFSPISKQNNYPLYSTLQMYAIRIIKNALMMDTDKNSRMVYLNFRLNEYYRYFNLLNELNSLWEKREKLLQKEGKKSLKFITEDNQGNRFSIKDKENVEKLIDERLKSNAQALLKKYAPALKTLEYLRLFFLSYGIFGLKIRSMSLRSSYLKFLEEKQLIRVEDSYKRVAMLNWLIAMMGGSKTTIKQLILSDPEYKVCPYCKTSFIPARKTQITCGSNFCISTHKNELKKKARKTTRKYKA